MIVIITLFFYQIMDDVKFEKENTYYIKNNGYYFKITT